MSTDNSNTGDGGSQDRPDLVGDVNHGPKTPQQWFNTAAFARPAQYTFGTAGRNLITSPGINNSDAEAIENVIRDLPHPTAMLRSGDTPETILSRIFDPGLNILESRPVRFHCPCSRERAERALLLLGKAEIRDIIAADRISPVPVVRHPVIGGETVDLPTNVLPDIRHAAILRIADKELIDGGRDVHYLFNIVTVLTTAAEIFIESPHRAAHVTNIVRDTINITVIRRAGLHLVSQVRLKIVQL
jgi:hypothetical protein